MKHKPVIEEHVVNGKPTMVYIKYEVDDEFLFRKTMSISLNAKILPQSEQVLIHLLHRDVSLAATTDDIMEFGEMRVYGGETKYYFPIDKWDVVSGDLNWKSKLNNWKVQ